MRTYNKLYINGQWADVSGQGFIEVVNPATEAVVVKAPSGDAVDVDKAVIAARRAFHSWSNTSAEVRAGFLTALANRMAERKQEFAKIMTEEMGIPVSLVYDLHIDGPIAATAGFAKRAKIMDEEKQVNNSIIVKEAAGVCAFINPWNYPLHQMMGKVAPALAAGCTIIAKAASQTPGHAFLLAEICDEIGLPAGVFNVVHGSGRIIGEALAVHPEVDVISFTGSTDAGIRVAELAAKTVKRVTQELGGKSPHIITEQANLAEAIPYGVKNVMMNTGQTCTALTRMFVAESKYEEAIAIAKEVAESLVVGEPTKANTFIGPMSSQAQKEVVLTYIDKGLAEGARIVTGGVAMPEGLEQGAYVRPTIFADVNNQMVIAQEEIFGPVLCMIPFKDEAEAIGLANDSEFGLSSGVWVADGDMEHGKRLVRQIRAGLCYINGGAFNYDAPFGGFKQSGNGREWGDESMHEFIEIKSIQM